MRITVASALCKIGFVRALALAMLIALARPEAAVLKSLQRGSVSFNGTATVTVSSLAPVDPAKSFLVFTCSKDISNPADVSVGGELTGPTTIVFRRVGTTGGPSVEWQVFEFESGVSVQRGVANHATDADIGVAISSVDPGKSFAIATYKADGTTHGTDDGVTAEITTSTSLLLHRTAGTASGYVYWQVVQYQEATVQKVKHTLVAGDAGDAVTISPVNTGKTMVVGNHTFGDNLKAADVAKTQLTNSTSLSFSRNGTTGALQFVVYAVEFSDGTSVQHGTQAFSSGETSKLVSITPVELWRSGVIGPGNFGRQGSTNFSADDNMGHVWFNYKMVNAAMLSISRMACTGSTGEAPYQIVSFGSGEAYDSWPNAATLVLNTSSTGANISGSVSNFPVLVRLSETNFNFEDALDNGEDIRFAKANGDHLYYEIEHWNKNSKTADIWVKVDQLNGNDANQSIRMLWGKPGVQSRSEPKAVFGTQNDFVGVWHMEESPGGAAGGYKDATPAENNATGIGGMPANSPTPGRIGNAQFFDGAVDYLDLPDLPNSSQVTVSAWYKMNTLKANAGILSNAQWVAGVVHFKNNNGALQADAAAGGTSQDGQTANNWYLGTYTYSKNGPFKLYVNGVLAATATAPNNDWLGTNLEIGHEDANHSYGIRFFHGVLDEARVDKTVRSDSWIKLCYENQKANQTLVSIQVGDPSPEADARLSALVLSSGTLAPAFSSSVLQYSTGVANEVASITLTPTANVASVSSLKVNGTEVVSGSASEAIPLNVGVNTVTIAVTGQNGIAKRTYSVAITRAASLNSMLAFITSSAGSLLPAFDGVQLDYSVTVPKGTASATVTPTAAQAQATIKVNGIAVAGGSASAPISLANGDALATIEVTAENGINKTTYTVSFITYKATSKKITVSGELLDINGNPIGQLQPQTVKVKVKLFPLTTGGTVVYQEDFFGVTVDKGSFLLRLGEGATRDNLRNAVIGNPDLFVEFMVAAQGGSFDGAQPLSPRLPLTSVPTSFKTVDP